jgi:polyvinyl alcohol dehydrogenase (cytochrome)
VVPVRLRLLLCALALALAAIAWAPSPASAAATCAGPAGGGDWPSYGHDDANTRSQPDERVISPADVPFLTPAWTFSTAKAGGGGDITGTPVISNGCAYVATNGGWVFALNADTGAVVWKAKVPYGGGVSGSVGVGGGRVYVGISRTEGGSGCPAGTPCVGPYVAAFNQDTGALSWATQPIDSQPGSDVFGSPVLYDGVILLGVSGGAAELGDEADRYAFQGSMVFIDAASGDLIRKTWTIHPPNSPNDEFAGAGIWSTPAVDAEERVAYVGTANPFKPQAEHKYANAVVKYDLDRSSPTFGQIIGSYKGLIDEYVPGLSEMPCFDIPGNPPPYYPQGIGSCGDIDLDFGASPNLFRDASGRKLVGAGQKSGVYHVFDAKTMEPVWTQVVGPPSAVGGIVGSTAYDEGAIVGPITAPGYLWSVSAANGGHRWIAPVADGVHWGNAVAVANGVVYTTDLTGFLSAFDARTGAPLGKRPLMLGGTHDPASLSWSGVSVARHKVYASVGIRGLSQGYVVAYRRGGTNDLTEDVQETLGGLGGGGEDPGDPGDPPAVPAGAAVVAGPGAASTTYLTPVMVTQPGGPLNFTNLDVAQHDVISDQGLFRTPLIGLGQTAPVEGLDAVQSGQSYPFHCSLHPGMRGTLIVR